MVSTPNVSVVIPFKNRFALVARAISSVRQQVGVSVQLILIDDGSDTAFPLIEKGGAIESIITERNSASRNAAVARNQGARLCGNDIIAFLDSDDAWAVNHLRIALNSLADQPSSQWYLASFRNNSEGVYQNICCFWEPYYFLFDGPGTFRTSCLVMPSSTFNMIGGFKENLKKHQDWDLGLRAGCVSPFLWNPKETVNINKYAPRRMSYSSDVDSSREFFDFHKSSMSQLHKKIFLAAIVKTASGSDSASETRKAREFALSHFPEESFSPLTRLFLLFPNKMAWMKGVWFDVKLAAHKAKRIIFHLRIR